MPKIIKDLDDKIFQAAMDLFGEHGYQGVDMKKISKKVGIAVGTLYNYYPNKQQLFLDVFQKSWQGTFVLLDDIVIKDIKARKKLMEIIKALNEEMYQRKGLGRELFMANVLRNDEEDVWCFLYDELRQKIRQVLLQIQDEEHTQLKENIKKRIVDTILITDFNLQAKFIDEQQENMAFLEWMIDIMLDSNR